MRYALWRLCGSLAACCVVALAAAALAQAAPMSWTHLSVASPPARSGAMMTYDAATQQVLLFGGQSSAGETLNDMWAWNGYSWSQLAPPTLPYGRAYGAMAYDPSSGQVILFGGTGYSGPAGARAGDTWSWNGTTWTLLSPATSPPYTEGESLAYDPAMGELVLFGGEPLAFPAQAGTSVSNQMWAWNGTTWTQLNPAQSPPARADAAMAYDSATSQLLLFGGGQQPTSAGQFSTSLNDTWTWNGTTWTEPAVSSSPAARAGAGLVFDALSGKLVLAGGGILNPSTNTPLIVGDSWAWKGSWSEIGRGPGGLGTAAAYDTATGQVVTFGGAGAGTWVYGPLTVETTSLPLAVAGADYSQSLQFAGGAPSSFTPNTWSVASGALPAGLSLSASGVISGVPTAAGSSTFTVQVVDRSGDTASRTLTLQVAPDPRAGVWMANGGYSGIEEMPLGKSGNLSPIAKIGGNLTGLDGTTAIAFDASDNLYVANADNDSITEYAAGMTGNFAPLRTISGPDTGLSTPEGVAIDPTNNEIYVTNESAGTVTVYAADAGGDSPPIQTITGLSQPWGIVITPFLWVAGYGNSSLAEFPAGFSGPAGNVSAPDGPFPGVSNPEGLGQDGAGNVYVTNPYAHTVTVYHIGGTFPATVPNAPVQTFSGLGRPDGVDVDAAGDVYISDADGSLDIESATLGATSIAGSNTGFSAPTAVAVAPPLAIASTRLDTFALGRRAARRLVAYPATKPVRWRLVRGRLPRGLRLTRGGVISGTPRRIGTFRVTVRATDSSRPAMRAVSRITITVAARPVVSRVAPGAARAGRRVTVVGRGFDTARGATTLSFGRVRALDVRCRSRSRCTAIVPPALRGRRRVAVTATVEGLTSRRSVSFSYRR